MNWPTYFFLQLTQNLCTSSVQDFHVCKCVCVLCPVREERTTGGEATMTSMSDVMTGDSLGQAIVDRAHDSRMDDDSSENPTSASTPSSPQHTRAKARQVRNFTLTVYARFQCRLQYIHFIGFEKISPLSYTLRVTNTWRLVCDVRIC